MNGSFQLHWNVDNAASICYGGIVVRPLHVRSTGVRIKFQPLRFHVVTLGQVVYASVPVIRKYNCIIWYRTNNGDSLTSGSYPSDIVLAIH